MSDFTAIYVDSLDEVPDNAFLQGVQTGEEGKVVFYVRQTLHHPPFPGFPAEEYRQPNRAWTLTAEIAPQPVTERLFRVLSQQNLADELYDYTCGATILVVDQPPFVSALELTVREERNIRRITDVIAGQFCTDETYYVLTISN